MTQNECSLRSVVLLLCFGLVLTGCGLGSSTPFNDLSDAAAAPPQEGQTGVDEVPGSTDEEPPVETEPEFTEEELLNWVQAPEGHCDDPNNLAKVKYVVDGDTVELVGGDKVRYIGVDAPETYKGDCFSQDAKGALTTLTPTSQSVCLLKDSNSSPLDPYGRLLRYVFVPKSGYWLMENTRLVRLGYAKAYHQFLSGKDYEFEFKTAEYHAKKESLGLWSACN